MIDARFASTFASELKSLLQRLDTTVRITHGTAQVRGTIMKSDGHKNLERIGLPNGGTERKVYDLDVDPSENPGYHSVVKLSGVNLEAEDTAETPRGLILCGHDNVKDAVADFESVRGSDPDSSLRAAHRPVSIELPTDGVLAGETASGYVRLAEPRSSDVIALFYSTDTSVIRVPDQVIVAAGETVAQFPIRTSNPFRATAEVNIHAMLPNQALFSQAISVRYNLGLQVR